MNPTFIILVIFGAIALWFVLSSVFFPIGNYLYKIWKSTVEEIKKEEREEEGE